MSTLFDKAIQLENLSEYLVTSGILKGASKELQHAAEQLADIAAHLREYTGSDDCTDQILARNLIAVLHK